jgi:hypothetical protein
MGIMSNPLRIFFDSEWLQGADPRDWYLLVRNLLTPLDAPQRSNNEIELSPSLRCDVLLLAGRVELVQIDELDSADVIL